MILPDINIPTPQIKLIVSRPDLPVRYQEILQQNPFLARIEGETKTVGWTDEETRTMQLLMACASNASLKQRLTELEASLAVTVPEQSK